MSPVNHRGLHQGWVLRRTYIEFTVSKKVAILMFLSAARPAGLIVLPIVTATLTVTVILSNTGRFLAVFQICESPVAHLLVVGKLLANSFLFCSCVCFCLYGPFSCISFHKFSRQLSAFSLCSSCLNSVLLVLVPIGYLG